MQYFGKTFQSGESVYSDWFPRGGDHAIIRAMNIDEESSSSITTITFYTKNEEEAGDGSLVSGLSLTLGDGTIDPGEISTVLSSNEFEELIRIKVVQSGGWLRGQVFPFVFFDAAEA